MKKIFLLIITGYTLVFITAMFSCEGITDCGPFPDKFKVVGMEWYNYKASYGDTVEGRLVLNDIPNDTVIYNEYAIFMSPQIETYYSLNKKNKSFELFNPVYACSPIEPETDEIIDSIIISTNKAFNTEYPAGSNLAQLFDIVILDQVNGIYYEKYALLEFLEFRPTVPNEMILILTEPPSSTTDFEFNVKYYQDGTEYDYYEFNTTSFVIRTN